MSNEHSSENEILSALRLPPGRLEKDEESSIRQMPAMAIKKFSRVETGSETSSNHLETDLINRQKYFAAHQDAQDQPSPITKNLSSSSLSLTPISGSRCADLLQPVSKFVTTFPYSADHAVLSTPTKRNNTSGEEINHTEIVHEDFVRSPVVVLPTNPDPESFEGARLFLHPTQPYEMVREVKNRSRPKRQDHLAQMYYKGLQRRRQLEEEREGIRSAESKKDQECSFHPQITEKAKLLKRRGSIFTSHEADNRLRQHVLLESWNSKSSGECRPIPMISKGSERIVKEAREGSVAAIAVEERLYLDSARRRVQEREREKENQYSVRITRTTPEIKAHIESLYMYESKRLSTLQKLREEETEMTGNPPLLVSAEVVVNRLTTHTAPSNRRCHSSGEETHRFEPKLNPKTNELCVRAKRRRMEQWYNFLTQGDKKNRVGNTVLDKIQEVLTELKLSKKISLDDFCFALDRYEQENGTQAWHLTPPPVHSCLDAELTFSPRVNPRSASLQSRKHSQETSCSPHQRLFFTAKLKQLAQREQERRIHDAALVEKNNTKNRSRRYQRRQLKESCEHDTLKVGCSETTSSLCDVTCGLEMPCSDGVMRRSDEEGTAAVLMAQEPEAREKREEVKEEEDEEEISPCSSSSEISPKSQVPQPQPQPEPHYHNPSAIVLSPDITRAAEELFRLIDTSVNRDNSTIEEEGVKSFTSQEKELHTDVCSRPSSIPSSRETEVNSNKSTSDRVKSMRRLKSSSNESKKTSVPGDLLFECALARPIWCADAERRRLEWQDSRDRLRGMGQALYEQMCSRPL